MDAAPDRSVGLSCRPRARRLIFCLSPGRCGTRYLAQLLGSAEGVTALHEPEPTLATTVVTMGNPEHAASTALRRAKLDAIAARLDALDTDGSEVYAETTHMFIHVADELMASTLARLHHVHVVVLRRPFAEMLRSRMALGQLDPAHRIGKRGELRSLGWLHTTNSASALLPPLDADGELTQGELLCGYLYDMELRARRFVHRWRGAGLGRCQVSEIWLAELNCEEGVRRLFESLHLTPTAATRRLVADGPPAEARNARSAEKEVHGCATNRPLPPSVAECERLLGAFAASCAARGVELPAVGGCGCACGTTRKGWSWAWSLSGLAMSYLLLLGASGARMPTTKHGTRWSGGVK